MSHEENDKWLERMHELNPKMSAEKLKSYMGEEVRPFKIKKKAVAKKMTTMKFKHQGKEYNMPVKQVSDLEYNKIRKGFAKRDPKTGKYPSPNGRGM